MKTLFHSSTKKSYARFCISPTTMLNKTMSICLVVVAFHKIEAQPTTRDLWTWPFAQNSIWNMPIGSNAVYVPANLTAAYWTGGDGELLFKVQASDPIRQGYAPGAWGPGRCTGTNAPVYMFQIADNIVVPDATPTNTPNNCSAFLQPDGQTIKQLNPLARCTAGGNVYGWQSPDVDICGDGIRGGHGGSGMSSIGGSIRMGELTDSIKIRHALKIGMWAQKYYYWTGSLSTSYRWPADRCDGYADATTYGGTNPSFKIGALLAIPPWVTAASLGLSTPPALKLFYALQDYGVYTVDDSYWDAFGFGMQDIALTQFSNYYGYSFSGTSGTFHNDLNKLFSALYVVDNNGPSNIGGGGTPRAPLAPPAGTPCSPAPNPSFNASFCNTIPAPIIDGIAENTWNSINTDTLTHVVIGSAPTSTADLFATYKARWDAASLYLLAKVQDDTLKNDSGTNTWDDDCMEVFVDGNNEKASNYDANDRHYIFRWNDATVYEYHPGPMPVNPPGVSFAQGNSPGGYLMEIRIDWSAIGVSASQGKLVGFEIHVGDDDNGSGLDRKITWFATSNAAATDPSSFGTIKLDSASCGGCTAYSITDPAVAICSGDSALIYGLYETTAGTYYDSLTTITGCDSIHSTALAVNSNPTVTITTSGPTIFCQGNTVTLTASSGNIYQWSDNSTTQSIVVSVSGNYFVTLTDANGCQVISAVTNITVNPLPTISITGSPTICAGDSDTLIASGGASYLWNTSVTTASIIVSPSVNSSYTVTGVDANGCSNTDVINITVLPAPSTPTITANMTTLASSSATGNQWYLNGNPISGATSQFYTVTQNGFYTVCVTNANGCSSCSVPYNFTATGIAENDDACNVVIYPNPSSGRFNVQMSKFENVQMKIYNVYGECIHQHISTSAHQHIDLSEANNGIYLMKIKTEARQFVKKIIINK